MSKLTEKPEIGQRVFLKPVGDKRRYTTEIKEYIVNKVGRKYLEVWDGAYVHSAIKFHLDSLVQVTDYSPDWKLYFSMQDILDDDEYNVLAGSLRKIFGSYGRPSFTLDQLRRIDAIMKEANQ